MLKLAVVNLCGKNGGRYIHDKMISLIWLPLPPHMPETKVSKRWALPAGL